MEGAGLVLDALGRVCQMVRDAISDLSAEEMLAPPKPHIAWLTWHIARVQDANFSGLLERPQLWITVAGTSASVWRRTRGIMVPAIGTPPSRSMLYHHRQKLLLDYLDAVFAQTKDYLSTVANADLNRVLNEPQYSPLPTLSVRLAQRHQLQHASRRSDRIFARPGEIRRLVSWCGKAKRRINRSALGRL